MLLKAWTVLQSNVVDRENPSPLLISKDETEEKRQSITMIFVDKVALQASQVIIVKAKMIIVHEVLRFCVSNQKK